MIPVAENRDRLASAGHVYLPGPRRRSRLVFVGNCRGAPAELEPANDAEAKDEAPWRDTSSSAKAPNSVEDRDRVEVVTPSTDLAIRDRDTEMYRLA